MNGILVAFEMSEIGAASCVLYDFAQLMIDEANSLFSSVVKVSQGNLAGAETAIGICCRLINAACSLTVLAEQLRVRETALVGRIPATQFGPGVA